MVEKIPEILFHDTRKDVYYAERKILKTLSKMVRVAQMPELKVAFEKQREQTELQTERLQEVTIIAGDGDRVVSFAQSVRLHRDVPGSTLHRLRGAGHMIHQTHTGAVMGAIRQAALVSAA